MENQEALGYIKLLQTSRFLCAAQLCRASRQAGWITAYITRQQRVVSVSRAESRGCLKAEVLIRLRGSSAEAPLAAGASQGRNRKRSAASAFKRGRPWPVSRLPGDGGKTAEKLVLRRDVG